MRPFIWSLLLTLISLHAEEIPIMTLDSFADVYYDSETENPYVSAEIKKLNGKTVRIAGYMVPFNSLENLKEFMLMPSSNGCNFCESPMKEEIVYVRQSGKKKFNFIPEPLVITGKLWINGAGIEPKNMTCAQFLYALEDAKVEKLKKEHHALLEVVTPRTIIKQVCSLLRVRLLKQVRFEPLDEPSYAQKRKELFLKYLGGEEKALQLEQFLTTMGVTGAENLVSTGSTYLSHWTSAFSDTTGDVVYYRKDLDLSKPENQRQIAIACYDVLFHHEIEMGTLIHANNPSYEELIARLSLILGLRQSFTQFFGSIGLIDLLPLPDFAKPHLETSTLPAPFHTLSKQLLINNASFIEKLYQSEHYQPYTKAIQAPPVSFKQITTPELYTNGKPFSAPSLEGYQNRFGSYLSSLILGCKEDTIEADGITLMPEGFEWSIQMINEEESEKFQAKLLKNELVSVELKQSRITIRASY